MTHRVLLRRPTYQSKGYKVRFSAPTPLTADDIKHINDVGHYLNESYVVMLYGVLECYRVIGNEVRIHRYIKCHEYVDILRRLRNAISHSDGAYRPNKKNRKLYRDVVDRFGLKAVVEASSASQWPLPINEVVEPLTRRCLEYGSAFLAGNARDQR